MSSWNRGGGKNVNTCENMLRDWQRACSHERACWESDLF